MEMSPDRRHHECLLNWSVFTIRMHVQRYSPITDKTMSRIPLDEDAASV
jgi:hypothetical protein